MLKKKGKSKSLHPSCVIYRGKCLCGEGHIGETERNVEKHWSKHNNPTEKLNQRDTCHVTSVTCLHGIF